jgi:hypothetical protein
MVKKKTKTLRMDLVIEFNDVDYLNEAEAHYLIHAVSMDCEVLREQLKADSVWVDDVRLVEEVVYVGEKPERT